jgi:hypothetical protein
MNPPGTRVDVRTVWRDEARDFTPWLAQDENLKKLGAVIGIPLRVQAREKQIGRYRADLVCRHAETGELVIIENQLGRTDHRHLGQLVTYAADEDACALVWIAPVFSNEHISAFENLNRKLNAALSIIGVRLEAWQTPQGIEARFEIARRRERTRSKEERMARQRSYGDLYKAYWQAFREYAQRKAPQLGIREPTAKAWTTIAIGTSGVQITATVSAEKRFAKVHISFDRRKQRKLFEKLDQHRSEIAKRIGESPHWDPPGASETHDRIRLYLPDTDVASETDWPRQHDWICRTLCSFRDTFSEMIGRLA